MDEIYNRADEVFWRRDGTQFAVEYTSAPICERGRLVGTVVTFQDITRRVTADLQIKRHEMQLAEAQHIARVGNWEWDVANDAVIWSGEMYRIFGLEPQSAFITYEGILSRVHPEDRLLFER